MPLANPCSLGGQPGLNWGIKPNKAKDSMYNSIVGGPEKVHKSADVIWGWSLVLLDGWKFSNASSDVYGLRLLLFHKLQEIP